MSFNVVDDLTQSRRICARATRIFDSAWSPETSWQGVDGQSIIKWSCWEKHILAEEQLARDFYDGWNTLSGSGKACWSQGACFVLSFGIVPWEDILAVSHNEKAEVGSVSLLC